MLSDTDTNKIVQNGINFLQAITEVYGTEKGMELWDVITNTLDPEVKGAIFFALIIGNNEPVINFNGHNPNTAKKIEAIRGVRTYGANNLGLKEAKDFVEDITDRNMVKTLRLYKNCNITEVLNYFAMAGFYVSH
jgi:Ribosomal protein L7/L12 C-terminal domain